MGQVEPDVLDAAFEAVERVTGQGVRARGGDSAERRGGHAEAEPAGGQALGEPGARAEFAQRARPVRTPRAGVALFGHRGIRHPAPGRALAQHGLHRGHELGSLDDLDLGVQLRFGQLAEARGEGEQTLLPGLLRGRGRVRKVGLFGRRAPVGQLLQGLGEGVRPPVRRYVRDHWRHLLSS